MWGDPAGREMPSREYRGEGFNFKGNPTKLRQLDFSIFQILTVVSGQLLVNVVILPRFSFLPRHSIKWNYVTVFFSFLYVVTSFVVIFT